MAGADPLNMGLSGLLAFQRAIATASQNVSNVDTEGYSRQSVDLTARSTSGVGALSVGGGVTVDAIRRQNDEFLDAEVLARTSDRSSAETRRALAERITDVIGDPDAGLSSALDNLVPALEAAAADPASVATRSALLSALEQAVDRIGAFSGTVADVKGEILGRVDTALADINGIADGIADINTRIVSVGGGANGLRDARDRLLGQLAERADITTVESRDGALSVFLGGQQPLVVGGVASDLSRVGGEPLEIVLTRRGSQADVTRASRGGELGGLVGALQGELEIAQNGLDRLALGLAIALNEGHARGIDLDGNAGGPLLTPADDPALTGDRALAEAGNAGNATLELAVTDVGDLPRDPMRLVFDGSAWTLFDIGGGVVDSFAGFPRSVAGFGFDLDSPSGTPVAGDAFVLRPAAGAARGLEVRVDDPRRLALASPVDAVAALANAGSAGIAELTLDTLEAGASATDLPAAITLTYDATLQQFAVSAPPGGALAYVAATDSGARQTLTVPGLGDLGFEIAGAPEDGDLLTLSARAVGAGDERNARSLVGILGRGLLDGGNLALADGPGRLIGTLAASARSHAFDLDASTSLLDRAVTAREQVSGVNLDEEAANLLRFQQAYEASARVVAVSGQLFRTLLNAVGS